MALKFKHKIKVGLKTRGSEKERKVYIQEIENREIRTESDAKRKTGLKQERSGVRSVTQK
jgi:hypothetical protein